MTNVIKDKEGLQEKVKHDTLKTPVAWVQGVIRVTQNQMCRCANVQKMPLCLSHNVLATWSNPLFDHPTTISFENEKFSFLLKMKRLMG